MTLAGIDHALESMATDAREENESMEQSYARLLRHREPACIELLRRRDRVELVGPEG